MRFFAALPLLFALTAPISLAQPCWSQTPPAKIETPTPGAPNLGDTIQPSSGNGGYEVTHYALEMVFSEDLTTYVTTTTIDARATQALSQFNLDLKGNEIGYVWMDGKPAKWSRAGEELQITPPAPLKKGAAFTVRVSVSGLTPSATASRLLHPLPLSLSQSGDWIQTVNQPASAHWFAALDDHPSKKAPATITIIAPSRFNSIANGDLVDTQPVKGDPTFAQRRFEVKQKLAPELLQIGVGPFTVVNSEGPHGIKLRSALPTDQLQTLQPQLSVIPEIIQFLEARLGPFPQSTYGLYVTPVGGDLETQSLTVVSIREMSPQSFKRNDEPATLAHEASHEYFGNSVSPRRWSDAWLNEGHATYYETLWKVAHGDSSLDDLMKRRYERQARLIARNGPVAKPNRAANRDPDLAPYNDLIYSGGAVVLYALQQKVGEETFKRIERTWVETYRDGVAGTDDYIALASRVSGQNLSEFLRSWLYSTSVPPMPNHPDWKLAPLQPRPGGLQLLSAPLQQ